MGRPPTANTAQKTLLALPDELVLRVGELIPQTQLNDLNSLARSNKRLYTVLNCLLYRRDAMFPTPYNVSRCTCQPPAPCARPDHGKKYRKCYALFWAAINAERPTAIRTAEYSLDAGADINIRLEGLPGRMRPPFLQAVCQRCGLADEDLSPVRQARYADFIHFLVARGADISCKGGRVGAIQHALMSGSLDTVRLLLENGADPNAPAIRPEARLLHMLTGPIRHQARRRHYLGILQLLLQHGADPNPQDEYGMTPLHCLVQLVDDLSDSQMDTVKEAIQSLLEHGADPNLPTGDSVGSWRALTMLVSGKKLHAALAKLLLEHGADTSLIHLPADPALQDSLYKLCHEVLDSTSQRFEFLPAWN